jgi:predicted membrane chloride channel (bestrophin family)
MRRYNLTSADPIEEIGIPATRFSKNPMLIRSARNLLHFRRIINLHTFLIALLAMLSTWICIRWQWLADLPSNLIAVAIIFPIVFSISAAWKRREEALSAFASLKSAALCLFFAHRDWVPGPNNGEDASRFKAINTKLFESMRSYFLLYGKPDQPRGEDITGVLSSISRSIELLREKGVPANEISRANQYLRDIVTNYERLRSILHYRTPVSLRSYSTVFLNSFPILFGPSFAYMGDKFFPVAGYLVAAIYSIVLVSLDHIQHELENPFDGRGCDDVHLELPPDYDLLRDVQDPLTNDQVQGCTTGRNTRLR